jgi:glycosyltransferase involved in cell wall biosynthesis
MPIEETSSVEVSVVMPCLNEADTLQACITKTQRVFYEYDIRGEIIIADNQSKSARVKPRSPQYTSWI